MPRARCAVSALLIVGCLGAVPCASAMTYVIHPDGSGDFPTIQAAIDAAAPGDILELTDGWFRGTGNRDLNVDKRLVIRAQAGPSGYCIIDCEASSSDQHRGMKVQDEAAGTYLQGITIQDAWIFDAGGAISCYETALTIDQCIFWNCYAEFAGGAIYAPVGCELTVTRCLFPGNWTNQTGPGGAVYIDDGSTAHFSHCTFNGNWGDPGSVISCTSGQVHLDHCTLDSNDGPMSNCALFAGNGGVITAANTIISFGTDKPVYCTGTGTITLTCGDVYGNAGGDWIGCIASQYGVDGNISADPLYCWPYGAPFAIDVSSPCAHHNNPECGQIGAWAVGCPESEVENEAQPFSTVRLAAPEPNPSGAGVRVCFSILPSSRAERVDLDVYDAAGRLVRNLLQSSAWAGYHETWWDGRNQMGQRAGSGIYHIRLTVAGTTQTRRVCLLR